MTEIVILLSPGSERADILLIAESHHADAVRAF
jgi:hypothetical protein